MLTAELRLEDVPGRPKIEGEAGRYGGDEFCIMFPHTPAAQASVAIDRLRARIAGFDFTYATEPISFTMSAGIAELSPDATLKDLMDAADCALYEAKTLGRNRVIVSVRYPAKRISIQNEAACTS